MKQQLNSGKICKSANESDNAMEKQAVRNTDL